MRALPPYQVDRLHVAVGAELTSEVQAERVAEVVPATWTGSGDAWTGSGDAWTGSGDTWTGSGDAWTGSGDTWTLT